MVGKRSNKAIAKEEGLEKTDNNLDLTSWPQINGINQKNYYTEYLKREDQILVLRLQNEEIQNRMAGDARDRDRTLAHNGADESRADLDDELVAEEAAAPGSEPLGAKIVIMHPGSQNLRIGFANDALPKTVPMVIARRWHENEAEMNGGEPSPKRVKVDGELPREREKWFGDEFADQFTTMCADLKTRMRLLKMRLSPSCKELVVNFNRKSTPEIISEHNDPHRIDWTDVASSNQGSPDCFVGWPALRIPDDSQPRYRLFRPLQHGCFNEAAYERKNALFEDVTVLLDEALRSELGLRRRQDRAQLGCVFVIPDLYDRVYVSAILDILLRDLAFGRVCFIQESVAASFGAGYSVSCIVDVGAQTTTVCCVDEGMCIEHSRVNLKYGGADVTELLARMLLYDYFPYADLNLKRRHDWLLAEELKQRLCVFPDAFAVQLHDFHLRVAGRDTRRYQFKTFDEPYLACLVFSHSGKLAGRRKLLDCSYDLYDGSPNDPLSAAQVSILEDAGLHYSQAQAAPSRLAVSIAQSGRQPSLIGRLKDAEHTPRSSIAGSPVPESTPQPTHVAVAPAESNGQTNPIEEAINAAKERDLILPVIPLDQAIIKSITHGARGDDRKLRDFFGGIMVIGGGAKFPGFNAYLEERLNELQPALQKEILIGSPPRELDPQVLVWKGGSVFGKLTTNDSWIGGLEYDRLGSRVLAYKCMWSW